MNALSEKPPQYRNVLQQNGILENSEHGLQQIQTQNSVTPTVENIISALCATRRGARSFHKSTLKSYKDYLSKVPQQTCSYILCMHLSDFHVDGKTRMPLFNLLSSLLLSYLPS